MDSFLFTVIIHYCRYSFWCSDCSAFDIGSPVKLAPGSPDLSPSFFEYHLAFSWHNKLFLAILSLSVPLPEWAISSGSSGEYLETEIWTRGMLWLLGCDTPEAFSRHMQKIDSRPQSSCLPSLHICVTPSHSENPASPQYYYIYLLICLVPLYTKTIFRIAIPHHYQLNEVQHFFVVLFACSTHRRCTVRELCSQVT